MGYSVENGRKTGEEICVSLQKYVKRLVGNKKYVRIAILTEHRDFITDPYSKSVPGTTSGK